MGTTGFASTTCRTSCFSPRMTSESQAVGKESRPSKIVLPWLGRPRGTANSICRRIGLLSSGGFDKSWNLTVRRLTLHATSYTRALACSSTPEETQTIRLNRALAFLKTRQHDAAFSDVESATAAADKPAEKALFRKAEALYGLQQYRECCEVLKKLRLAYPDNMAAKSQLTRAISRLTEHANGKYRFKQLQDEAACARPPHLDHATYIGPVRIQASGSRGRGLFTTKAVKAGDLLFCEKAFTHAFFEKEGGFTMLVDPENGGTMGSHSELIDVTIQKLHRNPSLMPIITDLHHGSYQPVDATYVDGEPVVDTYVALLLPTTISHPNVLTRPRVYPSFLIRRIVALNCFGCPQVSTVTWHQEKRRQGQPPPTKPSTPAEDNGFHSCGIWPTASYINHSCTSNARRAFIGDMLIARATRDLPANTEVTWWYQPPHDDSAQRNKTLLRQWGFVCDCPLCEDEKSTSAAVVGKREALATGLRKQVAALQEGRGRKETGVAVAKIEAALDALAATYTRPASEVPRLAVWVAMQRLLMAVVEMEQVPMARKVRLLLAMLESLGHVIEGGVGGTVKVLQWGLMMDGVVECWAFLRDAYRLTAPELVVPAEGYARAAYKMVFGEDETFVGIYGE